MTQTQRSVTEPAAPRRGLVTSVALAMALVPTLVLLIGIPLHDPTAGSCDAWAGCSASARDQWEWTARPWATRGIGLAAFIVVAARLAPWLRARPEVVRRVSVVALCLLVPLTGVIAVLAVAVWNTSCTNAAWICFGGPEAALVLGSPGLVTGVAALLLLVGAARRDTRTGRLTSALTVTALAAAVVAVAAGMVAGAALGAVAS